MKKPPVLAGARGVLRESRYRPLRLNVLIRSTRIVVPLDGADLTGGARGRQPQNAEKNVAGPADLDALLPQAQGARNFRKTPQSAPAPPAAFRPLPARNVKIFYFAP